MDFEADLSLKEWAKDKPLSILQLDPADRAVLRIADERDAIQKKTFTKWVNKHLKKANRHVNDLFTDLQDGLNLICLLEVLSGQTLHREKGKLRFHMLQNVELVLNFLRYKNIKLVNIRPEDIVDGNPKLTLGLIWTIILHFQIADIVVGEEPNVSAKDVLLRWARKSTAKYPGVRVNDFTSSWRDGLAFNAIIHRNRPDLIDWRQVRTRNVRERLETAFYTAEKVGVTRLLDPEDVDTHEIDEKSIITYISSMYDVFPEPPTAHPLDEHGGESLTTEYREVASSLHLWLREKTSLMQERPTGISLSDLKKVSSDLTRFKAEEVPPRQRDKQKLQHLYRDLQKLFQSVGEVDIEPELHIDLLERNWTRLMNHYHEKDAYILEEMKRLEKLQRLAEKVQRDTKRTDSKLDDLDTKIQEESHRIDRLHPLDAKHNVDVIEQEMRSVEEVIQSLFQDVSVLKAGNYHQAPDLHKRVTKLHQRWVSLRTMLHSKLVARLASLSFPVVEERTVKRHTRTVLETRLVDTNHHFRSLEQAIEWCRTKLKQMQEADYGIDPHSVKSELIHHQREHKEIDQFQSKVDQCVSAKSNFQGEELALYTQHLSSLQKLYADLLSLSNKRLSDLETLLDYLQSAQNQLSWLHDKQHIEVARDWSDKDINVPSLEQYYESMMSELEKKELSVRSVMQRGEALLLQGHPGAKGIQTTLTTLQDSWAYLLQLTLALETHLKTSAHYQAFYKDLREVEAWISSRDEILNTTYSASDFNLDEGERLLKGMQELREELNSRSGILRELAERATTVSPIKQRRLPVNRPFPVVAVCDYKKNNVHIDKNDEWILHDNSALTKWRVSPSGGPLGEDTNVPGVVFTIPPPDREAVESVDRLHRMFERTLALWQRKQLRMRQNMIFTTIRVVRSWDLAQFVAMGADQRNAIRRALNEDADKLLSEGDPSDPQLRRLRREMEEVNRLFDEFERRARLEEENKTLLRQFNEHAASLQTNLDELEKTLNSRITNPIPRDIHSLEHLVIQHKEFETTLKSFTPQIESLQSSYKALTRKNPNLAAKVESLHQQWNRLWNSSHLYIERLKCVEIVLAGLDEANNVVSELEMKLASFGEMPAELEPLQNHHDDLIRLQNSIAAQQPVMDQLIEDATNARRVVVKSRERLRHDHADIDRMDDDVNAITTRWNNLCATLVDRLRSCEAAYSLLDNYGKTYQTEVKFIDESYNQLSNLPPVSHAKHHIEPTKVLFTSIVERTQPLEQVNMDGGRFIREAKIYNMRIKRWLEEVTRLQPSLDVVKVASPSKGEEDIASELDVLNHRFLALVRILQDRLRQMAELSEDPSLLEAVSKMVPAQLKTFRTEFSLFESSSTGLIKKQYEEMGNRVNGEKNLEAMTFTRTTRIEEGIGTTGGLVEMAGIKDPSTGRVMKVGEAIRARVLNVRAGTIHLPNERPLTLQEAVARGVLDPDLARTLLGPPGIPGTETMLEAIQRELAEAERADRPPVSLAQVRVKVWEVSGPGSALSDLIDQNLVSEEGLVLDRFSGELLDLQAAVDKAVLNPDVAEVYRDEGKVTVADALTSGLISDGKYKGQSLLQARQEGSIIKPMTLKDAVELGLYKNGKVSGKTIQESMALGVLDRDSLKSIRNTETNQLVTLNEALDNIIVDTTFKDLNTGNTVDIPTAVNNGWVSSVTVKSLFDVIGFKDYKSGEFVSLNEALTSNLIRDGELKQSNTKTVPFETAVSKGLLREEVYNLLNTQIGIMSAGKELSVIKAVLKGYIDPKTGFVLDRKHKPVHLDEAVSKKLISKVGAETLFSLLNITLTTQTVTKTITRTVRSVCVTTLEEAVRTGLVDEVTQTYTEPETGKQMPVQAAIEGGLLQVDKSPVKDYFIKAFDFVSGKHTLPNIPKEGWSLSMAISKGLFDPTTGMFVIPNTDRQVSFEECLNLGIINSDSGKVVDLKKKRDLNFPKAISKGVLDSTGHYDTKEGKITMKEAIKRGLIVLEPESTLKMISPGVIYDPDSGVVVFTESGLSDTLFNAVQEGKIPPEKLNYDGDLAEIVKQGESAFSRAVAEGKVQVSGCPLVPKRAVILDPDTGMNIPVQEALKKRVPCASLDSVQVTEAHNTWGGLKMGLMAVAGAPVLAAMALKEAIVQNKVNPKKSTVMIGGQKMTVQDALDEGLITPNTHIKPGEDVVEVVKPKIELSRHTTIKDLAIAGAYDPKSKSFIDPTTLKPISFEKFALQSGLLDPNDVLIKDPTGDNMLGVEEALKKGVLSPEGSVTDPRTGKVVDFFEALKLGWVSQKGTPSLKPNLSLKEAVDSKVLDPEDASVKHNGEVMPMNEAIIRRVLDPQAMVIREGSSYVPLEDAVEEGKVSLLRGTVTGPDKTQTLSTAFLEGKIRPTTSGVSLEAALKTGELQDPITRQVVDVPEAVLRNIVDPQISLCQDMKKDTMVTLDKAIESGIVKTNFKNNVTGQTFSLPKALKEGYITTVPVSLSLIEAINGYYNPKTGKFLNPVIGEETTMKSALENYVDPQSAVVKPPMSQNLSIPESIASGIINDETGLFMKPYKMTLDTALAKGYILPSRKPLTFPQAIALKLYDPETNQIKFDNESLTIKEALKKGLLVDTPSIMGPELMTIQEAIDKKVFDPVKGTIAGVNLYTAFEKGILLPAKRRFSLPEAINKGLYDPNSGEFVNPTNRERLSTDKAIYKGVIDPKSTLVRIDGKSMTFEHALEEGRIDQKTGSIKLGQEKLDFAEAFEQGVLIEARRPMKLKKALANLFDPESCLFLDPFNGELVPLGVAVNSNLIDPDSVKIADPSGQLLNLKEAILAQIVDPITCTVKGPQGRVGLQDSFKAGLLVDSDALSLQKVLKLNLYDPKTGKISLPGKKITLQDAMTQSIVDPYCYVTSLKGKLTTLTEACQTIIDPKAGTFCEPGSQPMDLSSALDLGLIIDFDNKFGLYDALEIGLYENKMFLHPVENKKMRLSEAVNDLINPESSYFKHDNKYLNYQGALEKKLLNPVEGTYGNLDLMEAKKLGYIVPCKRKIGLEEAVKCDLIVNGKFIDPSSNEEFDIKDAVALGYVDVENVSGEDFADGEVFDPKTGKSIGLKEAFAMGLLMTLGKAMPVKVKKEGKSRTVEEAVENNEIDGDVAVYKNPQTGKFASVKHSLHFGILKPDTKLEFPKNPKVQMVNLSNGDLLFLQEPLSFKFAVDQGLLDLETGVLKTKKGNVKFKEAITFGLIDPDSVLMKDSLRKRLIRLTEAFRRGLMTDDGNLLEGGRVHSLKSALDSGALLTQGLSLLEALDLGLYDPPSGTFDDPFCLTRRRSTLSDAFKSGLIDGKGAIVKDPVGGHIVTLDQAVFDGILDPKAGRLLESSTSEFIDFVKARDRGYIIPAEGRQAMEEKWKLCDESLRQLLEWIGEVEDRLASQDVAQEDSEQLRNQINLLKLVKEELDSQQRIVSECLDQVRVIVSTGSEYLTRDEVSTLERNGKSLRTRFDRSQDRTDKFLRKLGAAFEELSKFRSEIGTFSQWLDKSKRTLEDKERSISTLNRVEISDTTTRDFVSDVIAHQADLRFITMAAQKFFDESKEYLSHLNDFRTSLPSRLSHIEPISGADSGVRSAVNKVSADYRDLLNRSNALADRLSGLGGRQRDYTQALERMKQWINSAEPRVNKLLSEPLAADPHALEEQLNRAKVLNNEFLSQGRLVDNLKQSLDSLLRSVEGQISPSEVAQLETPVKELTDRYNYLCSSLTERVTALDTALVQSQGVEDGLDSVISWLSSAENSLKTINRPASLHKDRLEEQIRELKMLLSDIESHRNSVESISDQAKTLVAQATNPRLSKRIDTKLRDVITRFEKLLERAIKRGELLAETSNGLASFSTDAAEVERWLGESLEGLAEGGGGSAEAISAQRDGRKEPIDALLKDGRNLVAKKDVTDTSHIRDRIKGIESDLRQLNSLLDERLRLGRAKAEQTQAFERLRDQVTAWLSAMEAKVSRLEPVALHMDTIKRQLDEIKPMIKEHRDYGATIDKVFDLGNSLDMLSRSESPTRRRSSVSPVKRTSISAPMRRTSQEGSPSPTKAYSIASPLSPGSSGFGSRRPSQDAFHLEELTEVQQELTEINNRYSLIGVKLSDRQSEIDSVREELRKSVDNLKTLDSFLDKVQRSMPRESLPNSKEEADKANRLIKGLLEELYEKQSLVESTKSGVNELLRKRPSAVGAEGLSDQLAEVSAKWKALHDACKSKIQLLEDLRDILDAGDLLSSWLISKEKMTSALGPISTDPRMVQTQIQQVQVLREELRAHQPQLNHLAQGTESVIGRLNPSTEGIPRLRDKTEAIVKRWSDLQTKLDDRFKSLGAAVDSSREFDAGLSRLRDTLTSISDQVDAIAQDRDPQEQLRKLQGCERQLEGVRSLLADAEAAGEELCRVLTDTASKSEIQAKLNAVDKQYNTLQAKLDQRKAEIEGLLRDGREFEALCAKTLGWLTEELGSLSERLLISADRDVLQQQLDHHEPLYKEVLSKEHEVIMLLDRGSRLDSATARQMDALKQQWEKLRREAVDRHTRLQTCMEHCRKYYKGLETFIPWLSQAENKLDSLRPESFNRRDVDKHLRELATFRNDVWKKSGEFEHLRSLGETFLGSCDVDKEIVKQELAAVKDRWDKLNNELLQRTSRLEEISRRLIELSDRLRELNHSVQRCEDKLSSYDSLGGSDPNTLARLKAVREEATGLKKPLGSAHQSALDLESEVSDLGRVGLTDDALTLKERLDDLICRLDDRCNLAQSAAHAISQFNDKLKALTTDLSSLEMELEGMKPPGRDIKTVRTQQDQLNAFINKVSRASDDVSVMMSSADSLVDSGFSPDATRQQAEAVARQLATIEEKARSREEDLDSTMHRLQAFQSEYDSALDDITRASTDLKHLKPVGSEVDTIKSQQEEFAHFRSSTVESLGRSVEEVNRQGQGLVQSAGPGVSTSHLEKQLEKMNDQWNSLKEKINERGRKLDAGLLQSGKFQEALEGFSKWLADTEEMVANQRAPSADYKVIKAQMQEQKFLKKMLLDRQGSMSSLCTMGAEVGAGADATERAGIERQLKGLMVRFDDLTDRAARRMEALEQAMAVAKDFQDKLIPVVEWLEKSEKKIKDMELIPTDEERIQQRIREHDNLHNEILRKKSSFSELTEVGSHLMSLVGDDEAAGVADKVQEMTDRYAALVDNSDSVGQLLEASRAGLRHLVITYQQLQAWMEGTEQRLSKYRVLAVHTEKLIAQMEDLADLTEEISNHQADIDGTVDSGLELMKHISNDEAIQLKEKLDSLQRRYNELTARGSDLLKQTQEGLPLVQQFHNSHNRLVDWMLGAESHLQSAEPREEDIERLEADIQEFRPVLENINQLGPQLCSLSPGEGASTIEGLVTRDNRRFDAISDQIQRKAERLQLSKQRSLEVLSDIDSLLEWFREVEAQLREAEPPSSDPAVIRLQLKEHKALNDDIASQKGRVRDVLSTGKKVLRESNQFEDTSLMRDKMADLRETMETVWSASGERLSCLEQALGLGEHLLESHNDLASWLTEMETQLRHLPLPAIRPDLIAHQQDRTELLLQSISEHKPLVDKLNKTGEALIKLVAEDEGLKVQEMLDSDNARYSALRAELKNRQDTLEKALQESSQFSDKLEGMLRALANTAEEVQSAEPVSAHVPKIKQQQKENKALSDDLHKREEAFNAVKKAAHDVISKAPNAADPAVKDVKRKLERLTSLWNEVQDATKVRGRSLDEALAIAARFWNELQSVMATLTDLENSLTSQQPPAVRPHAIHQQQQVLQEIKAEIDQTKPEVEEVRRTGQSLMALCGEPDKPEVKKHIEDLDSAWDNVTALFAKREENLINAMEKAMEFHETLQSLLDFLTAAEDKFARLGPLGSDINAVKAQIAELKAFKSEVDPHMVKVEALNRQAQELTERTSAEQAVGLKDSLAGVNLRWEELHKGLAERNRQLENSLLRLGQFHHALAELLGWIDATDRTLDKDIRPVVGDPQLLEVELAKLKVLVNDIQAHQSSVDTLNDAGRQLIESGRGSQEASTTQEKLGSLNKRWKGLLDKAATRQTDLEEALRDAQRFAAEIQDLLSWLGEVDGVIAASKPVGGLPETATEQLERFMEVYNELEQNRPKVEAVLATGQEFLKRSGAPGSSQNLNSNLKTLKQRWDSVTARANDKKIKLEIALKEATEFHEALQGFVDWLTSAEKRLSGLKPVSRVLETILGQIEEHKGFQKEVGVHRETMIQLDKKGTHLKYFSQKQDVILIKNLLISVQHRWERVVSKSAERTRALDHGYKEAKEFHDSWANLMNWLTETEGVLDEVSSEIQVAANDPVRLKTRLNRHRETQKALAAKQPQYDATLRAGKALREKAPKSDETPLKNMVAQLKEKWNTVCSKAVDRQRKLEEALLYCGQFKDALEALMDWLRKTHKELSEDSPVHGDLDTVTALMEQHKGLEEDLRNREGQMESVEKTGKELAGRADGQALKKQLDELTSLWRQTNSLAQIRTQKLQSALKQAEELHKAVHMLLEWLSDAEMKLRFVDNLPDDEIETRAQIAEHEKFMRDMKEKEREKDATIALAESILSKAHPDGAVVIKHWITIIQSRWEEVTSWAKQREQRLQVHLRTLQDMDTLLEELLAWLAKHESNLLTLERQELPDSIPVVETLITEHQEFMENMAKRQTEVDSICKAKQVKQTPEKKSSLKKLSTPRQDELRSSSQDLHDLARKPSLKSSRDNLADRRGSRSSPGRDVVDSLPHIGPKFPAKGSKTPEPQFKSPRVRLLYDRWRSVWLMAWERQRRLQEHLNHLKELKKLEEFSWDEWRKRFLKFMNHKKSRLTDLFRKMDKNNDNLIPREDFIDGIIKTKFDTSRLEMGAVADMFDHNSEGYIDWREFIAALRPDWEERKPVTEAEKIHDEVKRLVMLCTCRQKFRVFQVGEGKYRFGDSQKLRLVRILRSTVMVRVGGGWVALEEFLVKNDPCRAKGRTNIELREQFILADGVSQSLTPFKPKSSTSSGVNTPSRPESRAGPITKVREKSYKSVPMTRRGTATPGSVDSLSDTESSPMARTPRKSSLSFRTPQTPGGSSLPGSRNNSRPASRQSSKPPSRYGSNQSLASSDDGTPSRIPRRSVPTVKTSGTATPTQRKLTAPSYNGTKSPTSTLTKSKIPVYIGLSQLDSQASSCSTSSGARTPSGPTTPTTPTSKTRRPSTDSTPTEPKAPFRL